MKPIRLLPPVLALVIVGSWLGIQRKSLATLEQDDRLLRELLAAANPAATVSDPARAGSTLANKRPNDKGPIRWKQIADQLMTMRDLGGLGDLRVKIHIQQRLAKMTGLEIVSALDDIAALGLTTEARAELEEILLGPLIHKDPQLALTRFVDRLQEGSGGLRWQLANAMKAWAKKDPAATQSWFDQQIAAGKFDSKALDGRSEPRIIFESIMVETLLSSDPPALGRRLAALPENQRADVVVAFLESPAATNNKEQARVLAAQIADESRRAAILERLK